MNDGEDILKMLKDSREAPPPDFVNRVMAALPERPAPAETWRQRLTAVWPEDGRWLIPATAGALVALLLMLGLSIALRRPSANQIVTVTFALNAPDAGRVELAGSFNDWRTGEIILDGPDKDGPWTVTMDLPAGRHEYLFFVDCKRWITDPDALVYRPDGFGNRNAVLEI